MKATGPEGLPEADDFKRISGIGPVIERHLHEAGVRSFAQLAALTPEQIAAMVAHLPLLSSERIVRQDWIGRAQALAREAASGGADAGDPAISGQRYATFSLELLLDAHSRVRRTRVVHLQGGTEQAWDGWSVEQLVTFIGTYVSNLDVGEYRIMARSSVEQLDRQQDAGAGLSRPVTETSAHTALDEDVELLLELGELFVEEVVEDELGRPFAETQLRARLPFALTGSMASQLGADKSPYSVVILASDVVSGSVSLIGTYNGQLLADRQHYDSIIDLMPSGDGRFQLLGTVLICQAGLVKSTLGPLLRILS